MKSSGSNWTYLAVLVAAAFIFMTVAGANTISVRSGQSIQAAVNAASAGDKIEVESGVYRESLNITKPIVLAGKGRPLLDSGAIGSAITLRVDGIVISGFDIKSTRRTGIHVFSSSNVIRNNTISGCLDGIRLDHSGRNSIADNDVNNNTNGINLILSNQNAIDNNSIRDNNINEESDCGIFLAYSTRNAIRYNNLSENGDCSISLRSSGNNSIVGNNVRDNDWYGISLEDYSDNNLLAENNVHGNKASGIYLDCSRKNLLDRNAASDNSNGISLDYNSNDNLLVGNNVSNNQKGLHLANHSSNNTLRDNTAMKNGYGIYLTFSAGWNLIFANHLIDNGFNAYDKGLTNNWDNGSVGNYYSDLGRIFYVPGGPSVDRYPQSEGP
jgi:parallel beta-helix repeat protein